MKSKADAALLGTAAQDYLKNIYKLERGTVPLTPSLLAEKLGVSPAAVTKMLRRLQELRLINYTRSQELSLTEPGEQIALEVIRHHRLLELYLTQALGYTWDQVDAEAERLEHVISEEFEQRIDRLLGHPTHDPHGDPIPTVDGRMESPRFGTLGEMEPGASGTIRRVSDDDPEMLRYMAQLGLFPDTPVRMLGKEPYGGSYRVLVGNGEQAVGRDLAACVFVAGSGPAGENTECGE